MFGVPPKPVQGLMSHPLSFKDEDAKLFLGRRYDFRFDAMSSFEILAFLA